VVHDPGVLVLGAEKGVRASLRIVNLDPGKRYRLVVSGERPREIRGLAETTVTLDTRADRDLVLSER
jgi:hypothetical protein